MQPCTTLHTIDSPLKLVSHGPGARICLNCDMHAAQNPQGRYFHRVPSHMAANVKRRRLLSELAGLKFVSNSALVAILQRLQNSAELLEGASSRRSVSRAVHIGGGCAYFENENETTRAQ